MSIKNSDLVSVSGYIGFARVTVANPDEDKYTLEAVFEDGEVFTWFAPAVYLTLIDDMHPVVGTTWLDEATGNIYRLRGYHKSWTQTDVWEPYIAIQYPSGAMGSANYDSEGLESVVTRFKIIWSPERLSRA